MRLYYREIGFSWDEALLGKNDHPQSVRITTPGFFDKIYPKYPVWDIGWKDYFDFQADLFDRIKKVSLSGRLEINHQPPFDYMRTYYWRDTIVACVSQKVKTVFEELQINEEEAIFCPISIPKVKDSFYLLFAPIIPFEWATIDYLHSVFTDKDGNILKYSGTDEFLSSLYSDAVVQIKKNVISPHCKSKDVIHLPFGPVYFSNRIINAFKKNTIVGSEIIEKSSIFYKQLAFSDEE